MNTFIVLDALYQQDKCVRLEFSWQWLWRVCLWGDAIHFSKWVPTFWRNLLPPFSG